MTAEDYNSWSMPKYGWSRWHLYLDEDATMEDVTEAVKEFQREYGLSPVDGKVGPQTIRRLLSEAEARRDEKYPGGYLYVGDELEALSDARVVSMKGSSGLSLVGLGGHGHREHEPTQVVWHWDATLSAETCHKVLKGRGYSTHIIIDNDGTIYQCLDLKDHVGYHARGCNRNSIGIDLSNVVNVKPRYSRWYAKRYGQRPLVDARYHGRTKTIYGYYPAQIHAAKELVKFLYERFGIPMQIPRVSSGPFKGIFHTTTIDDPSEFRGHIAHLNITTGKWDPAGFPFSQIMAEARKELNV